VTLTTGHSPHRAWIEIDHAALVGNLRALRSLAEGHSVIAVVKANAYGHGAVEVSRTLVEHGVERLGVATLGEGLALRRAGIGVPILVLWGLGAPEAAPAIEADLEPIATDEASVDLLERAAAAVGRRAAVQLKVDTGLGRQGSTPEEAVGLALRVARSRHLRLAGIFSHLAVPGEDEAYTDVQHLRLAQVLDATRSAGVDPGLVHIASTGGLLAGTGNVGDAIRPGLGLYGMIPGWARDRDPGLRPVLSLKALPLRIFNLAAGEGLGYGLRFRAATPTRIATLGIGYGDGWPRAHANNGWVLVRGVRRPVVGAISMDGITVDLGDLHDVTYDDEFVLIGEQMQARIDADEVAAQRRTINYEVTTALRERLPRVHLPEPAANPG
jgi:alanine racemase